MNKADAEHLWRYLLAAHPGFNKQCANKGEVKKLWVAVFALVPTYKIGHTLIGRMLGEVDWPTIRAFNAVSEGQPWWIKHTEHVDHAEEREAVAQQVAWDRLSKTTQDLWRQRSRDEWTREGMLAPEGPVTEYLLKGHARARWWAAEGRAKPWPEERQAEPDDQAKRRAMSAMGIPEGTDPLDKMS